MLVLPFCSSTALSGQVVPCQILSISNNTSLSYRFHDGYIAISNFPAHRQRMIDKVNRRECFCTGTHLAEAVNNLEEDCRQTLPRRSRKEVRQISRDSRRGFKCAEESLKHYKFKFKIFM
ncbi:hypothetical protein SLEP1_g1109 [Rubroshorea leprosula]|uniref:Uncharacterized protein n=1 Tax=Rubroshorea leprosula TaxID=152421 RepID=A0AAV5HCR2_9ROSI|nr:hypothetical protein SLEP1_g1109 [Rubroshorea leprosula]